MGSFSPDGGSHCPTPIGRCPVSPAGQHLPADHFPPAPRRLISTKFTSVNFSVIQEDTTTSSPVKSDSSLGDGGLGPSSRFLPSLDVVSPYMFLTHVVNPTLFVLNFPCSITLWLLAPDCTMEIRKHNICNIITTGKYLKLKRATFEDL